MHDRTLAKTTKIVGENKGPSYQSQVEAWSRKHDWRRRCEAWDRYRDQQLQKAEIEERQQAARDMVRRHLGLSAKLQTLAEVELDRWLTALASDDDPEASSKKAPTLSPKHIQDLLDYSLKLERLNRGEPESITETREKRLSREEIEVRIEHLLKARQ
jgi:hypothetical protein